jgi:hypothetical protein
MINCAVNQCYLWWFQCIWHDMWLVDILLPFLCLSPVFMWSMWICLEGWRRSFMPQQASPLYPLVRRVGGHRSHSGYGGKKNGCCWKSNPSDTVFKYLLYWLSWRLYFRLSDKVGSKNTISGDHVCLSVSVSGLLVSKRVCQIFVKFSVGVSTKNCQASLFCKSWLSDSHTLLKGLNEF